MPLTATVFWVVYVGGLAVALLHPVAGLALYILVYHVHPESQWWGGSIEETGIRTALTVAVVTGVGMLLRYRRLPEGAKQFSPLVLLMLALVGYGLLTLCWAEEPVWRTAYQGEKVAKLAIIVLMLVHGIRTPAQYQLVLLAWVLGTAYIGYQAWGGGGGEAGGRLTYGLGGGDFADSSGLSVHLVASLPLMGSLFFMMRGWSGRLGVLFIGALTVNTIIMTRTRNAIVGVAAMALAAVFWAPRGYRLKLVAGLGLALAVTCHLADPGWWERMATLRQPRLDSSAANRLQFWGAAVRMACDHPLGVGIEQFRARSMEYVADWPVEASAHSTYMACLAELGLPGFLLLIALIVVVFRQLARTRGGAKEFCSDIDVGVSLARTRFSLGWHALGLQCALLGYLACGAFTTRLYTEGFWLLVGLSAALVNVSGVMRRQAGAAVDADVRNQAEAVLPARAPLVEGWPS